jgi:hypothetical protein
LLAVVVVLAVLVEVEVVVEAQVEWLEELLVIPK